jgi:hypothetical protein
MYRRAIGEAIAAHLAERAQLLHRWLAALVARARQP